jgi:RNase P/RNase MRP subunit p30
MGKRFIDLHVHSTQSTGKNSRREFKKHAEGLGVEIRFCDGAGADDGLEIEFKARPELKKGSLKSAYLILEPLSKEAFQAASRINSAIIRTTLTPTSGRALIDRECAVEVCLSPLFNSSQIKRIRHLKEIKTNLKYSRKFGIPMVATTGSNSIYDLRTSYQIFELLRVLGFKDEEARQALYYNPKRILEYGQDKIEEKIVTALVKKI